MWFVGMGGLLGAISRFLLGKWITKRTSNPSFFYATWAINLSGSFVLGLFAALHLGGNFPEWLWLLFGTGFLGAYTTFSTFGYETIQLLHNRNINNAILYVSSSVLLGVLFAWIGGILARILVHL